MKKPKLSINFGEGGFQGWLVRHCEKIVLGVVAFLALWVIWGGYSLSGLERNLSPDKLKENAGQKRTQISNTNPEDFLKDRQVRMDVEATVVKMKDDKILPEKYYLIRHLNKPDFPRHTHRTDPDIFPPIKLKPVPIVGALAYVSPNSYVDPLDDVVGDGKKPARRPPPKPKTGVGGVPVPGAGIPGAAGGTGRGNKGKGRPMGGGGAVGEGMDLLSDSDAPGASATDGAMPGMGMAEMGGMGGATASGAMLMGQFHAPNGSIAKTKYAVVLMALVQHEKQWDEYQKKLAESLDYNQLRDQPTYLTFAVQRVDVTDNPDADPATLDWDKKENIISTRQALADAPKWAGFPTDILDPNYLMPVDPFLPANERIGLTHPLPPFIQRDLWEAMTHPDIPLASAANQMQMQNAMPDEATEEGTEDVPGVPGAGRRAGGMPGMPGAPGAGMMPGGRMPGAGAGMPGVAGAPGESGAAPGMSPGMGMMPGMPGGGMMPGAGMMPGIPGAGGGFGYASPLVKYKLIRITDFNVEPGRKYRYRVSVIVDDPNNPAMSQPPKPAALDPKVATRVNENPKKTFVTSPWSAPSDVVSLPPTHWFYASKVVPDSPQVLVQGTPPVPQRETTATALAVVHDPAKGADVPTEQTVIRGSTLTLKADVEVVHPVYGDIRKLKDYIFKTDAVVADILGGEPIPPVDAKAREEKLTVPGELLFVDADGNLIVRDESADVESFRRYVKPKEEDKPKRGQEASIPGAAPGDSVPAPGESSVPGASPGKGRRKGM